MDKIGFLFDLDGVLADSENEYTRIWNEIDRRYPSGVDNFALAIKGQTLSKILADNYPEDIRPLVNDLLHRLEKEMKYSYCKGARECLSAIRQRGIPAALVTSSDEVKMAHLYKDMPDIRDFLKDVIDASRVSKSKPDPEGYVLGAEALGVPTSRCAVVEDSVQGVRAGRASGAYVVGITGTKSREDLAPYCDIVLDSLDQLDIDHISTILSTR